jgi:hypothetical protein
MIPALWRMRQENHKLKISLDYITRSCLLEEKKVVGSTIHGVQFPSQPYGKSWKLYLMHGLKL